MRLRVFLLLLLSHFSLSLHAQIEVVELGMGSSANSEQEAKEGEFSYNKIDKETVRLLTIGIGSFKDPHFYALKSYSTLDGFKKVSNDYLPLSYHNNPEPIFLNRTTVRSEDVRRALRDLAAITNKEDLVIVSFLSHGELNNGEYYLVCTDTDSKDYSNTAISGNELRGYFEQMANTGAVVIVFIDTCNASALFEQSSFSPKSNGSIVYYASSRSGQTAKEINQECRFTSAIIDIFQNKVKHAFNDYEFVTVKSLESQIDAALKGMTKQNKQEPMMKYFTNSDNLEDFPIIKNKEIEPPLTIWENPRPFCPIAISPYEGKGLDYALISLEGLSIISFVTCGFIQEDCKAKIRENVDNAELCNQFREKGKTAAIGCWISTGVFVSSYALKVFHVRYQYKKKHREEQYATIDIAPSLSPAINGLTLVYKF